MKILHIIPSISNSGGIEKYVYDLSINKQIDCEVSICTFNTNNNLEKIEKLKSRSIKICSLKKTLNEKIKQATLALIIRNIFLPYIIKFISLKYNIKKNNPDIIYAHGEDAELITSFINFEKKINVVHGEKYFPVNPIYRKILGIRRNKNFYHSLFVSKSLVNRFEDFTIIKTGIDQREFNYENEKNFTDKKEIAFGYLGRLSKEKGVENLINGFIRFSEKNKSCILKIGGNGKQINKLKSKSKILLNEKIFFLGEIINKKEFYSSIDVLIIPSYTEGFPYVMLEAMCSGVIVIANNVGGIKDIIKNMNNGILMQNNRPETIQLSLQFIIENKHLIDQMINSALETVKDYSLKNFVNEFYNNVISISAK